MANFTNLFLLFASLNLALVCTSMPAVASSIKSYPNIDLSDPCALDPDVPMTTVSIANVLAEGESLTIHCKSKDDDLGTHVIGVGQIYSFTFRPNLLQTTLYFCSISWSGASKSFDIYNYRRDNKRCCGKVEWSANVQGLYCPSTRVGGPEVFLPWK